MTIGVERDPWPCAGCGRKTATRRTAHRYPDSVPAGSGTECGTCHRRRSRRAPQPTQGAACAGRPSTPYVDEVVVERLLHGDRNVRPNAAELAAAVAYCDRLGYSSSVIADRIGITQRTVVRHRARARMAA